MNYRRADNGTGPANEQSLAEQVELAAYRKLFDLTGRRALVIGAGSGIGEAASRGLAAFGAHVVCADVNTAAATRVAASIESEGGVASAARLDVTEQGSLERALEGVDTLDVMVCTPSVNVRKRLLDVGTDEFEAVVRLNLGGSFNALQVVGRRMQAQGKGSIILLSSIRSQVVEPGQGVYAATKAGVVQMARALAAELGPRGVRVNLVAPGVVETPLTAPIKERPEWYRAYAEKSALNRWATTSELVGPIVYLASDASSYVTGSLLFVDGGWTAIDGRFAPPL